MPLKNERSLVQLSPNPAKDKLIITIHSSASAKIYVRVYDAFSREVIRGEFNAAAGTSLKEINIARLPAGVYMINVSGKEFVHQQKLVRE